VSITEDLDKIKLQEQALRFSKFDEADAWALGCIMRDAAAVAKLPLVIDIRIGIRPLFYAALPGTTPENPDWVRRKVNTVLRFLKSSYAVGLEYKSQGKAFDSSRGIDIISLQIKQLNKK